MAGPLFLQVGLASWMVVMPSPEESQRRIERYEHKREHDRLASLQYSRSPRLRVYIPPADRDRKSTRLNSRQPLPICPEESQRRIERYEHKREHDRLASLQYSRSPRLRVYIPPAD